MRSFLVGLLVGFCVAVGASGKASDWIVQSGLAYHFDRGKSYNWFTAGVGMEKTIREDFRLASGFYLNSHKNWSVYTAGVWLPFAKDVLEGTFRLGAIAGGVTGYRSTVTPVAGLALTYEQRGHGFNLLAIPTAAGSQGVLWGQYKIAW